MKKQEDVYADALYDSISADMKELTIETIEASLKSALDSGIIDSIPFIGILGKGKSIITNISNYLITKNVLSFLYCIKDVPLSKRVKFMEKISKNKKVSNNFSMLLLGILSKIDEEYKSGLIGYIFRKMIYEQIDEILGVRLIQAISKLSYIDLNLIKGDSEDKIINNQILMDSINGSGIITMLKDPGMSFALEIEPVKSRLNDIGKELIKSINEFDMEYFI